MSVCSGGSRDKSFTVVMRGPSAVVFRQSDQLRAEGFPSDAGPVNIVYQSRWLRADSEVTVPGHLWVEVSGKGASLDQSLRAFPQAGLALLPVLSLSANAAIGDPELELGFDSTQGAGERDYFQSNLPPERGGLMYVARYIDSNVTVALVDAIKRHPERERLLRAAEQYRLALGFWERGGETLSLAHLWMALETLTKPKITAERQIRGMCPEEDLASALGVSLERGWKRELHAAVRKDLLLHGDGECYRKAKKARNGLEHGYLDFGEIRELSGDVRPRVAGHVRTAILELSGVEGKALKVLTEDPFHEPLGHWAPAKYLRGRLVGDNSELAREGHAYPFVRWKTTITKCRTRDDGQLDIECAEEFTPELAEGITFQPVSLKVLKRD